MDIRRVDDVPNPRHFMVAYTLANHQSAPRVVFRDPVVNKLVRFRSDPARVGNDDDVTPMNLQTALCHRCADDLVARRVEAGVSQVVVLDAGLSTVCYRRSYPNVRLFEVDVASTQRWKRQNLALSDVRIPPSLRYIEVGRDYNLAEAEFKAAGYDFDAPTLVVWMDSVLCHPPDTFTDALDWFDQHRGRLELICSYLRAGEGVAQQFLIDFMSITDPIRSLHDPAQVSDTLRQHGFDTVDHIRWQDMLARYLPGEVLADPIGACVLHAARPPAW